VNNSTPREPSSRLEGVHGQALGRHGEAPVRWRHNHRDGDCIIRYGAGKGKVSTSRPIRAPCPHDLVRRILRDLRSPRL
jgi:hypothetical protein